MVVVQLHADPDLDNQAIVQVRAAQASVSEALPHVALVPAFDLKPDIHPPKKTHVAHRLARATLKSYYGGQPVAGLNPRLASVHAVQAARRHNAPHNHLTVVLFLHPTAPFPRHPFPTIRRRYKCQAHDMFAGPKGSNVTGMSIDPPALQILIHMELPRDVYLSGDAKPSLQVCYNCNQNIFQCALYADCRRLVPLLPFAGNITSITPGGHPPTNRTPTVPPPPVPPLCPRPPRPQR